MDHQPYIIGIMNKRTISNSHVKQAILGHNVLGGEVQKWKENKFLMDLPAGSDVVSELNLSELNPRNVAMGLSLFSTWLAQMFANLALCVSHSFAPCWTRAASNCLSFQFYVQSWYRNFVVFLWCVVLSTSGVGVFWWVGGWAFDWKVLSHSVDVSHKCLDSCVGCQIVQVAMKKLCCTHSLALSHVTFLSQSYILSNDSLMPQKTQTTVLHDVLEDTHVMYLCLYMYPHHEGWSLRA